MTAVQHDRWSVLIVSLLPSSYYVAEGVRIFSQESWRLLFGDNGRTTVERFIDETVRSGARIYHRSSCDGLATSDVTLGGLLFGAISGR